MDIGEFYGMWVWEKKEVWRMEEKIRVLKGNVEEWEMGLGKKEEEVGWGSKNGK